MVTRPTGAQHSLVTLIDAYCRRTCRAVLDQHPEGSVSSPLGIWLLLAACSTAASGDNRRAIEETLGCPAAEATTLLASFLEAPPPALHSALALWVRGADRTSPLVDWSSSLPPQVERGPIPSQSDADAWADRHTLGLITRFPVEISPLTRLVLASALATKVSWQVPLEVVPAAGHVRDGSPWVGRVEHVLLDRAPVVPPMLARTDAAGVVAAHFAVAAEGLGVLSVAADPSVDRSVVFEAAYEIARRCRVDDLAGAPCSLFDLPLGGGHSWEITEAVVPAFTAGERSEEISAVLAAWSVDCDLDLKTGRFGIEPALDALLGRIGPSSRGDDSQAIQSAIASYTPTGFEAAAISVLTRRLGSITPATEKGLQRRARLIFDHPYVAVALAGMTEDFTGPRWGHTEAFCLPLFSAWVAEPEEPPAATG